MKNKEGDEVNVLIYLLELLKIGYNKPLNILEYIDDEYKVISLHSPHNRSLNCFQIAYVFK